MLKKTALTLMLSLVINGHTAFSDPVNRIETAERLLETGKPDSAAVLLYDALDSIALESDGARVRTLYDLARAMEQLGRLPDQIHYLIMAREEGVEVEYADKVRLAYARILFDTGNLDGCIGITREFRDHFDDSPLLPDMLYITGNAYLLRNEYLRASNAFREITSDHPDSPVANEAIMKEGICLYHLELISGAIENLEQYMVKAARGKNNADALYYLGLSYEKSNRPDRAATVFNRLVLEYPSHPEVMNIYFRLGEFYYGLSEFAEAENAFENFIFNSQAEKDMRDEALLYLERIKFRTGIYRSEEDIAENFVAKYPRSPRTPDLLLDLARYYKVMGKTGDAVEKYLILMNNPLYAAYADSAAIMIADTYVDSGQSDKASVFLIRTADESTDPLRAQLMYVKLGEIYEAQGHHDEAIGWYDKALSVDSTTDHAFKALWGIGRTFTSLNRWFEAAKTLERTVAEFQDHPDIKDVHLALADVYLLQGRVQDSIEAAERSVPLVTGDKKNEILLFIAELYEEVDEDHALKLYSLVYNNGANPPAFRTKALMQFGDLSLRKGDRLAALDAFNRILAEDADSVAVLLAREKITFINDGNSDSETDNQPQ